jgi:hypothetical protein
VTYADPTRIFPPIQPHATPLHSIKRVLLLNREPITEDNGSLTISLRHYAITTKITGVPKAIRRLQAAQKLKKKKSSLPNLGKLQDVADYMLDPSAAGYTSASDTEADTDAEVEVSAPVRQKVRSHIHMPSYLLTRLRCSPAATKSDSRLAKNPQTLMLGPPAQNPSSRNAQSSS